MKDICIIQDLVVLPSGEEIRMDMAVVFKTGLTTTMFSRDAWFSEFITISNTAWADAVNVESCRTSSLAILHRENYDSATNHTGGIACGIL